MRQAVIVLAGILFLPLVSAFDFGAKTGAVLYGFQTRGITSKNNTQWVLSGARATIGKGWYQLEEFKLILHQENGEKIILTSPRCRYEEVAGVAESGAPIRVVGDNLSLQGVGYDILLGKRRLRIRSQVRMTIRRARKPGAGLGLGSSRGRLPEDKKKPLPSDQRKDCGEKR